MGAALDEATLIEHQDLVGGFGGGESVGDGDRGPSAGEAGDGPSQLHVEGGVDRRRGLVEDSQEGSEGRASGPGYPGRGGSEKGALWRAGRSLRRGA